MKISEMKETLEREFPGIYTSFQIEVNHHGTLHTPETDVKVYLYTPRIGFVKGGSFTQCVRILKALLNEPTVITSEDISFDFGANKI